MPIHQSDLERKAQDKGLRKELVSVQLEQVKVFKWAHLEPPYIISYVLIGVLLMGQEYAHLRIPHLRNELVVVPILT